MFWWFLNYWVSIWAIQEKELIRLKCEAKLKGGFYVTGGQTFVYHSHSWVSFHVWLLRYVNLCGRSPDSYILEFGTYNINAIHPKTRKILQLLRLRQVLHETHPLWYHIMVSGYCGFYLCFCLGHDGKYILLKGKAGSDYMLIVLCICSTSTLVFKLFRFKILES